MNINSRRSRMRRERLEVQIEIIQEIGEAGGELVGRLWFKARDLAEKARRAAEERR